MEAAHTHSSAPTPSSRLSGVALERDPVTGEVLGVDGAISTLLGLEPEELLTPTALIDRVHADDRSHVAPATGDSDTLLYRLRNADGSHVWVSERLDSVNDTGGVVSHLEVIETSVRHAQLQETLHRLTDAVVIFELGDDPDGSHSTAGRSVVVVAANEAGEHILGQPGTELTLGDKPELNGEDGDFIELLTEVIVTDTPIAVVLNVDEAGHPSTISVERLDDTTAVLIERVYIELDGVQSSSTGLITSTSMPDDTTPQDTSSLDPTSVAQSGLLKLIGESPNPLEILNGLAEHFSSECSTWALDLEAGTAQRTRCDEAAELPEIIELSTAALERLTELEEPVTQPDPAVAAVRLRLGSRTGENGASLAIIPLPNGEIFLAERTDAWDNQSLEQLGLVAGFATVATEANAALATDDLPVVTVRPDELLERERFIGVVTRSLLTASANNFDEIISQLRSELDDRFDVADIELWTRNSETDTTCCDESWTSGLDTSNDPLSDVVARWVHVVPCDAIATDTTSNELCGAVRFVASHSQWDTDTLQAFDAVAELLWQVYARVRNERRLAGAFLNAPVAVTVLEADGTISSYNRKYADFLGFEDAAELTGTALNRHATIDGRQQIGRLLAGEETTSDVPFRRKDDTIVWGRVRVATDADGTAEDSTPRGSGSIVHIEDVTESILKQRALEYRVEHDDLTLLATRQRLTSAIAEITRATNQDEQDADEQNFSGEHSQGENRATLLLIDLDTFESIRSRYGRDQADQVLRVVADRLRTLVRPSDLVARTGPAEFGILLRGDESDASALAERLLTNISEPVLVRTTEISTKANIGITSIVETDQVSSVLRKADNALDAAKGAGRLRSATFDTALFEQLEREERLEADLADAISSGQIVMHYQPEVSLRTGELLSFETLARWDHPELGMLDADEFVAHAERIGVVRDIDELALAEACQQMQTWQTHFPGRVRSIRVNISGTSIRSNSYIDTIRETISAHNIEPSSLWFEISEDELLRDNEIPAEQLDAIKSIGCKILIDDFGHGLSSFAVLRRLPVDALEIAPALIQSLGADPDASTIVAATIQLAQTLGLECVAEGVENITQMQELIELGCQRAHGFLYGPATVAGEFGDIINEGRINVYDANEG